MTRRNMPWVCVALVWSLSYAQSAHAESTSPDVASAGLADSLFQDGKRLMDEKNFAAACPKLEESHKLRPGGGTVLRLGMCLGELGKPASALTRLREARAMAIRDKRDDRVALAESEIERYTKAVGHVVLQSAAGSVAVRRGTLVLDGIALDVSAIGSPLEVDPGPHSLEAQPNEVGYEDVHLRFEVPSGSTKTVDIRFASKPVDKPIKPLDKPIDKPGLAPPTLNVGRATAISLWGISAVALGVGGYFALHAAKEKRTSDDSCVGGCDVEGAAASTRALRAANTSTILVGIGLAAVGAGVTVWWLSPTTKSGSSKLGIGADSSGLGLRWSGAF